MTGQADGERNAALSERSAACGTIELLTRRPGTAATARGMAQEAKAPMQASPYREGHHYVVDPVSGCWVWQLFKHRGYGRDGSGTGSHRRMYEALVGPIPADHDLHHRCENRACINPAHLEPITRRDHLLHHWRERGLTDEQVAEIVRLLGETSLTQAQIARRFGVPRTTVNNIAQGRHSRVDPDAALQPEQRCVLCGAPVEGKRRSARFCSAKHRTQFNSRKQTEKRAAERRGF